MTETPKEGRQIPLALATFKQLKAFAEGDMGITITNGWQSKHIKDALVAAGWDHPFILAPDEPAAPVAAPQAAAPAPAAAAPIAKAAAQPGIPAEVLEPMVEIFVSQQEGAGGKRAIFVGVNGVGMLIPRNKQVAVKLRYLMALESAVEKIFEKDEETGVQEEKEMPSYPFQVRVMPPQDEIAAWRAWELHAEAVQRETDRKHDAERRAHNAGSRAA